jgi:hypothetical protein
MFSFSKLALFFTLGAAALTSALPQDLIDVDIDVDVDVVLRDVAARCDDGKCGGQTLSVIIEQLTHHVTPICQELRECDVLSNRLQVRSLILRTQTDTLKRPSLSTLWSRLVTRLRSTLVWLLTRSKSWLEPMLM